MKTTSVSLLQTTISYKSGCYATGQDNDLAQVTLLREHTTRVITTQLLRVTLRNGFSRRRYWKQAKVSTQHFPMQTSTLSALKPKLQLRPFSTQHFIANTRNNL